MNTYLLGLISKWGTILLTSVTGIVGSGQLFSEETTKVENTNQTKNASAVITEVAYDTEKRYNSKLPSNITKVMQEGKKGLAFTDNQNNEVETIVEPVKEIIEVGTGGQGEYTGKMTGYGADCAGCSGTVSCKTKSGKTWNLLKDGTSYNDDEYGQTRILAAALTKFPCGTIIKVDSSTLGTFNAIVLDTGGAMRKAWNNGTVLMDLAFTSETSEGIHNSTNNNVKYSVQRWGW